MYIQQVSRTTLNIILFGEMWISENYLFTYLYNSVLSDQFHMELYIRDFFLNLYILYLGELSHKS
jgi:hypothetical protein